MLAGGTAVSLAAAWREMNGEIYDSAVPVELSVADLGKVCDWLSGLYGSGSERQLDLSPERIRLLPRGIRLIREFIRAIRAGRITITARDLRWGVVLGDGVLEWGYLADEQESPDSR
jgi:exopolyphosphatase/pppGpp-phosphohydrolase